MKLAGETFAPVLDGKLGNIFILSCHVFLTNYWEKHDFFVGLT
jgi:hypothetical protein